MSRAFPIKLPVFSPNMRPLSRRRYKEPPESPEWVRNALYTQGTDKEQATGKEMIPPNGRTQESLIIITAQGQLLPIEGILPQNCQKDKSGSGPGPAPPPLRQSWAPHGDRRGEPFPTAEKFHAKGGPVLEPPENAARANLNILQQSLPCSPSRIMVSSMARRIKAFMLSPICSAWACILAF